MPTDQKCAHAGLLHGHIFAHCTASDTTRDADLTDAYSW